MNPNPFRHTTPILEPERSMGRETLIRSARACVDLREHVSVLAPRQSGKTTFLRELERWLDNCVYVDCEGRDYVGLEDCAEVMAVAARLPGRPTLGGRGQTLNAVLRKAADLGGRVFIMDELASARRVAVDFLRTIRGDVANRNVFVVGGSIDLADLTLEKDSSLSPFNVATCISLEDCSGRTGWFMLSRRLADLTAYCNTWPVIHTALPSPIIAWSPSRMAMSHFIGGTTLTATSKKS